MAASYLTTANVDALIGAPARSAMFSDDDTEAGYNSSYFDEMNLNASAIVQGYAKNAGYSVGDTTTERILIMATLGQMISMLYARKGIPIPANFQVYVDMPAKIQNGDLPLTQDPSVRAGVGGFDWSDQSTTTSTGRPAIFSRDKMTGY